MDRQIRQKKRPPGTQRCIIDCFDRLKPFVGDRTVKQLNGVWLRETMKALETAPHKPRKKGEAPKVGYAPATQATSVRWLSVAILHWCGDNDAPAYLPFKRPAQPKGRNTVFGAAQQAVIFRWSRGTEDYDPKTRRWTPASRPLTEQEMHERRMTDRMATLGLATASRGGGCWGLARQQSYDCPYLVGGTLYRLPLGVTEPPNKHSPPVRLSPQTMVEIARFEREDPPGELYILRPFGESRPLSRAACARRWRAAMVKLGIAGRRQTCRHTAVTGLVAASVNPILIGAVAGMSLRTIKERYSHVDNRDLQPLAFPQIDALLRDGIGVAVAPSR